MVAVKHTRQSVSVTEKRYLKIIDYLITLTFRDFLCIIPLKLSFFYKTLSKPNKKKKTVPHINCDPREKQRFQEMIIAVQTSLCKAPNTLIML